ncbi:MAG: hypothetical protein C0427_02420 [Rhodobacter sp.]|nr:hypothetical protein [Rhodobacter sp.]
MTAADPLGIFGDSSALHDILDMAGPDTALRILHQIHIDLSATAALIAPAIAQADCATIRAQTHVLISLAGTIGATRLHAQAVDLNAAAHAEDEAAIATLGGPLITDLTALIALIAARPLPDHSPDQTSDEAAA